MGLVSFVCYADSEPTYSVDCEVGATSATQCMVDKDTYIGWRTFNSSCSHCHGQDGLGGSFAPSLVAGNTAVRDFNAFVRTTEEGSKGPTGVMPPFKDNPNINDKIAALYQYLKARSDKLLPPGRPQKQSIFRGEPITASHLDPPSGSDERTVLRMNPMRRGNHSHSTAMQRSAAKMSPVPWTATQSCAKTTK